MQKLLLTALLWAVPMICTGQGKAPLRIAVAGLSHGHVVEVAAAAEKGAVEVVGIFESDPAVRAASRLARMFPNVVYDNLEEMLDTAKPQATMAYGSIFDHLALVEACAPRGIHVMVEKPLAVNGEHARRMASLARRHNIHLLTNYETTWYPTNHKAREMVAAGNIGRVTRINIFDGHQGPVEINCGPEFLAWLTDPVLNGGGAVVDFGCYGANLATWLTGGARPLSVYAVLQQQKPDIYPLVDDDATIIVEYPGLTVEIMASWSWSHNRKDMYIYGENGYIFQDTKTRMRYGWKKENQSLWRGDTVEEELSAMPVPLDNPFAYLTAVVRGEITVAPDDLSALENNLTVVEILDAARKSARTKKAIQFKN